MSAPHKKKTMASPAAPTANTTTATDAKPTTAHPAPAPITHKLFKPTHPLVTEKDKSIHPEHGVIHYPFYYGGLASCVSVLCTQPLGVGESLSQMTCRRKLEVKLG